MAWRGKGSGGVQGLRFGGGLGGRGTGPKDGANFATCTCVVFLLFLTRTKRSKMAFFEGCPVGWGGGTHRSWPGGRGGRPRASVPGKGWGGGGANFATCVVFLLFLTCTKIKMTFFEGCPVGWGGGTHQSWPGGRGGRPRALVAGEGCRGRMAVPKKGEGWGLVGCPKRGKFREGLACLAVPQEGARARGGIQGLRFRKGRVCYFSKVGGLTL